MVEIAREEVFSLLKSIYPFRRMEDEAVNQIADRVEFADFTADQYIYEEGQDADAFYIVLSGNVRVIVTVDGEEEMLSTLHSGDFLGYEALSMGEVRRTSAVAMTDTTLLVLNQDRLNEIQDEYPELSEAFDVLEHGFRLILQVRFGWLAPDEAIHYLARRHPIFLAVRLIPIALLVVVGVAVVFLMFASTGGGSLPIYLLGMGLIAAAAAVAWVLIDWLNDYSIVTDQRVIFQERVVLLYDSRQEAPLTAIQSVTTESSFLGRQFNFGNVVVRTFTGLIVLPDVRRPLQVAEIVEAEWYRARASRRQTEKVEMERSVREIVGIPVPPRPDEPPEKAFIEPSREVSWFSQMMANLFQMRFDFDGNIIYRKHWWILVKYIWLPTLMIFALLIFGLFAIFSGMLTAVAGFSILLVVGIVVGAWWLYQYMDWRNDYYMVTDEQVLDVYKKPLAHEERRAAPLRNIQSIEFERLGLIGLILNYGTVYIRVGDSQLTFDDIFNPAEVQRELFNRLAQRQYKDRLAEVGNEQRRISDWLTTYHRLTRQDGTSENPPG